MNGLSRFFKDPITVLLAALVALSLLAAQDYVKEAPGLDYYVAWVAADAVENRNPNYIYDRGSRYNLALLYRNKADEAGDAPRQKQMAAYRQQLPMTATPFLYWVTAKLSTGDYENDLSTWHLLSLFLITASILLMCRILGYSPATRLAILLPVLVWFVPLHSDLRVANVNGFQLGLVGLIFWLQSRGTARYQTFLTGIAIGLLVMFKPNLGAVAVLVAGSWLVRRQYDQLGYSLAGLASGGGFAVLVSSWWISSATAWFDWLRILENVASHGPGNRGGNYAAITQVSKQVSPLNQLWLALALCAICLVVFWWGQRSAGKTFETNNREHRVTRENMALIAMGCLITMLASTLVWLHYYLLTLPMLIVLLRPWSEERRMPFLAVIGSRLLPVIIFVFLLDSALPALTGIEPKSYWTSVTMAGTVVLFIAGLWQLGYGVRDQYQAA